MQPFNIYCKYEYSSNEYKNRQKSQRTGDGTLQRLRTFSFKCDKYVFAAVYKDNGFPFKPQRTKRKSEIELAVEEADQLMKDPNAKTYNNFQEILDELGIEP